MSHLFKKKLSGRPNINRSIANAAGAGEKYSESLLKNGLLDSFNHILIRKPQNCLIENIAYCLANIMSFEQFKNSIRVHACFESLVSATSGSHLTSKLPQDMAQVMAWVYSNALFAPYPERNMGFHLAIWLCEIFYHYSQNEEIASEACWGIFEFLKAEPDSSHRRAILYEKRTMRLVANCVDSKDPKLQQVALACLELYAEKNNNYDQLNDFIGNVETVAVPESLFRACTEL